LNLLTVGPKFTRPACRAPAAAIDRYLLPAPELSSKPASRRCCCRSTGQTDGQTDGRMDTRWLCKPAPRVKNWKILLVKSFTACMPLLMAPGTFGSRRIRWSSPQQHCPPQLRSVRAAGRNAPLILCCFRLCIYRLLPHFLLKTIFLTFLLSYLSFPSRIDPLCF